MLYMIGHHRTTCFLTPKSLVMLVLAPMCLPISQIGTFWFGYNVELKCVNVIF